MASPPLSPRRRRRPPVLQDPRPSPAISRSRHRCAGIPPGCDLQLYSSASDPAVLALGLGDEWISRELRRATPTLADALSRTNQCLVLRGEVSDPPTLDYFRDAVGLVMALVESGGLAVFDPHMFKWWTADEWRELAFDPAGPVPRHHVVILVTDEPTSGAKWFHTRGLWKFGRPDLSVHSVTPDLEAGVTDLLNRFIEMLAFGAIVTDGQAIRMKSLPAHWRCFHRGTLDDPDFNNVHIEIGPEPAEKSVRA
ncbi:MAG TPA: hypothetical protein VGI39_11815 [Polyangiaceae bacterium]|jgi:hypothetical protein